jgi:hypothetical protein
MRKYLKLSISILLFGTLTAVKANTSPDQQVVSFYEVPLICGAAPEIGCGSRLKPLFIDFGQVQSIKEVWSNREGTVVAIVWNEPSPSKKEQQAIVQPIFKKNIVDAQLISNTTRLSALKSSLSSPNKWYRGMDVDLLSIEEAGIIAESLTSFALNEGVITNEESVLIKKDLEDYFKIELTQVRSFENLKSESTQERWRNDGYQIYVNHIGSERAQKVSELYHALENQELEIKMNPKSCCSKKARKDCCKKL